MVKKNYIEIDFLRTHIFPPLLYFIFSCICHNTFTFYTCTSYLTSFQILLQEQSEMCEHVTVPLPVRLS